jgi:hypothetical protein
MTPYILALRGRQVRNDRFILSSGFYLLFYSTEDRVNAVGDHEHRNDPEPDRQVAAEQRHVDKGRDDGDAEDDPKGGNLCRFPVFDPGDDFVDR